MSDDNELERLLERYPDKPWDWYDINKNPNITMDIIEKYPDKPWDWYDISQNPNITMDIIEKNPDKPWDFHGISQNPNITMDIIEKNQYKPWDWFGISLNEFKKHPRLLKKKQKELEEKSARIIQKKMMHWLWSPYTKDGKIGLMPARGMRECGIPFPQ